MYQSALPRMFVVSIKLENLDKMLSTVTGTCWVAQYISTLFYQYYHYVLFSLGTLFHTDSHIDLS